MKARNLKTINLFSFLVIFIFVAIIISGLLVPIYGDEISTKMTQATIFSNGGKLLTAIPQCFPELTMQIPASWYPAAGIYHLLYNGLSPLALRISGVVIALIFIVMVAFGFRRIPQSNLTSITLITVFVAVLGLGVMPLTLVLARSEQWLLLLLTYYIFFALENKKGVQSYKLIHVFLFLICTSLFFFTHPKSSFFFIVVIVSALIGFQKDIRYQIITLTFTVTCLIQTIFAGRELFKCEGAPIIASSFASQTVNISSLVTDPLTLLKLFYIYLTTFPEKAVQYTVFRYDYFSTWLPSLQNGEKLSALEVLINPIISVSILIIIIIGLILPIFTIFIAYFRGSLNIFHLLLMSLWISLIAHLVIYVNWNFYASVLPLGVLGFLICLSLTDITLSRKFRIFITSIIFGLSSIFLLSSFVLFSSLTPRLFNLHIESVEFGVPGQFSSIPTFSYSLQRNGIRQFSNSCGFKGDGDTRLVVDDLTYLAFENLREPMHLAYISDKGSGQDIKGSELIQFLKGKGSSGILAQCKLFPDAVLPYATKYKNLCCVKLEK